MGYLITDKNERILIEPMNRITYSVREISNLIGGIVEPLFLGNYWIFRNKNTENLNLNSKLTDVLNIPIYGKCFLASENELEPYFFFPKEQLLKMINSDPNLIKKIYDENYNENVNTANEDIEREDAFNILFNEIFNKKTLKKMKFSYDNIVKDIETVDKINLLEEMLLFFQELEEYEKCQKIVDFQKYLKGKKS